MKKIVYSLIFIALSLTATAQFENVLYYMNQPQATYMNPARQNNCSFYLGLPAISSFYFSYKNTGFRYADLFDYNNYLLNETDTSFRLDLDKLYNSVQDLNYLMVFNKINLLNFAFWVKDYYITFDVYTNYNQILRYPKSLFLLKDGNYFEDDNQYISLTNTGLDINAYTEYSLGVSKEVIEGLTVGGKLKLYSGILNVNTREMDLNWYVAKTEEDNTAYDWTFQTNSFEINTSIPTEKQDSTTSINTQDVIKSLYSFKNFGLGIDLGAIYKYNNFEVSASVVDLGFITWKNNPVTIKSDGGEFVFPGIDLAKYVTNYGLAVSLKDDKIRDSIINLAISDLKDTINAQIHPDTIYDKYKTGVNTKLHFGLAYQPTKWFKAGFVYSGMFIHKKLISSYTLSANTYFWNGWGVSLSYTMFRRSFNNIGLGLAYKLGPLQFYINADNIAPYNFGLRYLTAYDKPFDEGLGTRWIKSSRLLNFHFGINLVFGCKDRRDYGLLDDFDI